jgi:hypothetical protein
VINDIIPTFMTEEAYLEQANFNLQQNNMAHGGFNNRQGGELAIGVGREAVTGVLPLSLFREHWEIARLCGPPVYGMMCTLDVMGFSQ